VSDLPEPFTPPEADLRGMPYMPLDLVTLFDSDLYALSTGDEFKAALTLWGKSFYQVPAGSLPADDRLLEHLSGSKRWKAVRNMAMRGWIKCSDGRMYHKTVAEKVAEAWASRLSRRERTEAARAARHKVNSVSEGGNTPPVTSYVTESATEKVTEFATENVATSVTGSKGTEQNRTEDKKERKPTTPSAVADGQKLAKRAIRLPADWQPTPKDRQFALGLGLNVSELLDNFRDYWIAVPGQKGCKLDWDATFRNRCRYQSSRRSAANQPQFRNGFAQLHAERYGQPDEVQPDLPSFLRISDAKH
jgi:hypothetical protein